MIRVLVIFSNPDETSRLRLDQEDKVIYSLAKLYNKIVSIERQHAADIDDIYRLVFNNYYDIIHFSGHGTPAGIILEKCGVSGKQQFYTASQVVNLINIAPKPPLLVLFLCCFSAKFADILCEAAPFVITTDDSVSDEECIQFVSAFYESYFQSKSVTSSFAHAVTLLSAKNLDRNIFRLFRRELLMKSGSLFIECKLRSNRDSIIINLDNVVDKIDKLGMEREEILHLIAKKIAVHYWIFDGRRDDAFLPIGHLLFGSFSWNVAADVVRCNDLMRLSPEVSEKHWQLWSALLISYNDLASLSYRNLDTPADPAQNDNLENAINVFNHHIPKYLDSNKETLLNLGFKQALSNLSFIDNELSNASYHFKNCNYTRVIAALESALTHYHEIVIMTQPPAVLNVLQEK